jgi:hypothetical protein
LLGLRAPIYVKKALLGLKAPTYGKKVAKTDALGVTLITACQ